jgi:phage terminase Nu1 subunit (DNA packaging protein)
MTQSDLARALGLSKQAISKLKGQGMPVDSVAAAQAWREARQNVAQRKPAPDAAAAASRRTNPMRDELGGDRLSHRVSEADRIAVGGRPVFGGSGGGFDMPPDIGMGEDRDEARTRREIADANIAEMEEARMRRELIRVSAVQAQMSVDFATTRDALLQIPARMGPLLAAESDTAKVQNLLHAEIHQALLDLAGCADRVDKIEGAFD